LTGAAQPATSGCLPGGAGFLVFRAAARHRLDQSFQHHCGGVVLVSWQIPDPSKFLIISLGSFTFIMIVNEFLIRYGNLLRVLFGMKTLPASRTAANAGVATPQEPTTANQNS
jgi:hypothetical protein